MRVRKRNRGGRPPKFKDGERITVRLEREHIAVLDLLADRRDASRNDLIRAAVVDFLHTPNPTTDPEEDSRG